MTVKQIGHGEAEVSFGEGERPKYPALTRAINGFYNDLLRPLAELEETCFTVLPIPDPTNTRALEERLPVGLRDALTGLLKEMRRGEPDKPLEAIRQRLLFLAWESPLMRKAEGEFRYLSRQRRVIDEAITLFLAEIAGPDRTREGFVEGGIESDTPDGILQQREVFTHAVGVQRAGEVMGGARTTVLSGRSSPAVKAMLDSAFTRLSENGKMRLEGVRDEIHGILVSATDAGLGPLETARQLSGQFEEYQRFEFERLARTEAAFAAEAGSREQYREYGVSHVHWLISAGACPICVEYEGQIIEIDDTENQPPAHPNCLCSTAPIGVEE